MGIGVIVPLCSQFFQQQQQQWGLFHVCLNTIFEVYEGLGLGYIKVNLKVKRFCQEETLL